jgi:hypothetical protein
MGTQKTARLASNLASISGTRVRQVPLSYAALIYPQNNPICALKGGKYIGDDRKTEKSAPSVFKTKMVKGPLVEGFTNEPLAATFEVLTGTNAAGTQIVLEADAGLKVLNRMLFRVNETRDVFYVNAAPSTDTLTIVRYSGASAIEVGHHITLLGQIQGELSSNIEFIMQDETQHENYLAEMYKAFRVSRRNLKTERYVGGDYETQKRLKMHELIRDQDFIMLGGKSNSGVGAGSATTPRGLESWALDGSGTTYDFQGTVERSEVREFGAIVSEFCANELIMFTSLETQNILCSVLDSQINIGISDFASKFGLPMAKKVVMGPATVNIIPHNFYAQEGNLGKGIVVDPSQIMIAEMADLELHEADPFSDSTFASDKRGVWYYDGAAILPIDGGKSVTFFQGANSFS